MQRFLLVVGLAAPLCVMGCKPDLSKEFPAKGIQGKWMETTRLGNVAMLELVCQSDGLSLGAVERLTDRAWVANASFPEGVNKEYNDKASAMAALEESVVLNDQCEARE